MITSGFMVVAMLLSLGFSGLVAFALFTYIRRTWQVIRSEEMDSVQFRILDELDQLRTQNHALVERLERIEGSLQARLGPGSEDEGGPAGREPGEGSRTAGQQDSRAAGR